MDFDDLRLYAPGEDVGDIDWKSSARAGIPIVRRFARESDATVALVVDTGAQMAAAAPSGEAKNEIASFCCALTAYIARDRGDRVALVAGDAERLVQLPARASTRDLEVMLRTLENMWDPRGPLSALDQPLGRAVNTFHRRSVVILVTDEARPDTAHHDYLRRLRATHEVIVVQIEDRSPWSVPGANQVADVDGSLRLPPYLRGRQALTDAAATAVSARRTEVAKAMTGLGVPSARVGSTDELVPQLVHLVSKVRHGAH